MRRKVLSMVLAVTVMLAGIPSSAVAYASEAEKISGTESPSGMELPDTGSQKDTVGVPDKPESTEQKQKSPRTAESQQSEESIVESGVEAYVENPDLENAQEISMGEEYSGSVSDEVSKQYYKFAIGSSGCVNLTATANMYKISYAVYDSEGNSVWRNTYSSASTLQANIISEKLELTKGEYYFAVEKYSTSYGENYPGNYKFQLSFESAGETYEETGNGINNTMMTASQAELNKEYKGQIALNDDQDWYKFTLAESGKVHLAVNARMKNSAEYKIVDAKGKQLWNESPNTNSAGVSSINKDIDLTGGDYYLTVDRKFSGIANTGNYTFKLDYTSADEGYKETQDSGNDTFETASDVSLGEFHKGQIALNEEKDYYKFTMEASGSIDLSATANVQTIYYAVYDSEGSELWKNSYQWDSTSQVGNVAEKIDLTKGEYYFAVEKYSPYDGKGYTGNYSFWLSFKSAEESSEETGKGTNNTMAAASVAELNEEYKGQIALNDDQDWHKFTLTESGRIHLAVSAHMASSAEYKITDKKGEELWKETPSVGNTGASSISKDIDLTGGDYYLIVTRRGSGLDCTGNYTFTLGFVSTGESFGETQENRNDAFETASAVTLGEQYKG